MTHCNRSAAIAKRRGERGSPYLTPILQMKSFPAVPLRSTEEVAVERRSLIQQIHLFGKPLACNMAKRVECSVRSKAFSKSNLRITISYLD
jgi:hypothetical protein